MKKQSSMKRLLQYAQPYRVGFWFAMALSVLSSASDSLNPFIVGLAITELSRNALDMLREVPGAGVNFGYIINIILTLIGLGIVRQLSEYFSNYILANVVQKTMYDMRYDINSKINRLSVSFFDKRQQGEIFGRVTNDVDAVSVAMQQSLLRIVTAVLNIVFTIVMMLVLSVPMTLIAAVLIPASIWVSKTAVKKSQPYFRTLQDCLGEISGFVQESYTGFSVIKLYGQEEETAVRFREINQRLNDAGRKAGFISGLINPLVGLVVNLSYIVMTAIGGYYVVLGRMAVGSLQAFVQYIWLINQPLGQVTQLTGAMQSAAASLARVFEFLDEPEQEPDKAPAVLPEKKDKGDVSFRGVSFGYGDVPLIEDLNLEIKSGQMVAIVGPTGAGKTTLINLLMRFYDVQQGGIFIDGVDIRDMTRAQVRRQFGMVLQDAWLYQASIADNIRFGRLDATQEEIVEAAKIASVHRFIKTLPGGYDMVLDEEGGNVSLGQKQLLTIARVVVANPSILILDEATSSVDTRLEMLIQKAMKRVMQGRTSFVIAHRLSTIRDADLILVMDQGSIVEQGTHKELLQKGGLYENLYNSQFAK